MTDKTSSTHPDSDLHTLGTLVAGNLTPDAIPTDQWPALTALALQHGLAPMLHWTLKQTSVEIESNPTWQPLIRARYQTAIDWALKERAQLKIHAALRAAGIPAIWLKGSVLARTVYPEPSLRPMGDLDVLVPYEQREAALEVVRKIGFDFYTVEDIREHSSLGASFRPSSHHYCLQGGIGNAVTIELHFRLVWHDDVLSLDQHRWFMEHHQTLVLENGLALHTFTWEANLLYLAAHAVLQHSEEQVYLLRYFDFHRLITQTSVNWDMVLSLAVMLEWTFTLERALVHAVEYFSTPIPHEIFAALVSQRPAQENTRLVTRQRGFLFHLERTHKKQFSYLSPEEKLYLLFRIVFPSRAFMQRQFAVPAGKPVWPYYFLRWYNRGRIWTQAIWARLAKSNISRSR